MNFPIFCFLARAIAQQCPDPWVHKIPLEIAQLLHTAMRRMAKTEAKKRDGFKVFDMEDVHFQWKRAVRDKLAITLDENDDDPDLAITITVDDKDKQRWNPDWVYWQFEDMEDTHAEHPLCRWLSDPDHLERFHWVAKLGLALCHEYQQRFREHNVKDPDAPRPWFKRTADLVGFYLWADAKCTTQWTAADWPAVHMPVCVPSDILFATDIMPLCHVENGVLLAPTVIVTRLYRTMFCTAKSRTTVCRWQRGRPPPAWYTPMPELYNDEHTAATFRAWMSAKRVRDLVESPGSDFTNIHTLARQHFGDKRDAKTDRLKFNTAVFKWYLSMHRAAYDIQRQFDDAAPAASPGSRHRSRRLKRRNASMSSSVASRSTSYQKLQ